MTTPTTRTAVVAGANHRAELTTLPVVPLSPGHLLVQISHTAINPVDWKLLGRSTPPGSVLLKDYSGIVVLAGADTPFHPGDRVAGLAMGGLGDPPTAGAAATYATVEADLAWLVPASLGLADATTFGIAGSTAAFLLYFILGIAEPATVPTPTVSPTDPAQWIAVSGGSTQVGLFLIQWAKLSGYKVIATASERNFALVKQYGADRVVGYAERHAAITDMTGVEPRVVAELAGGSSWALSRAVADNSGARYVAVLDDPAGHAKHVNYGRVFKPNASFDPKAREWAAGFYRRLGGYVERGEIRPAPVSVRDGLEAIPQGLEDLKNGAVSGSKLVFRVQQ